MRILNPVNGFHSNCIIADFTIRSTTYSDIKSFSPSLPAPLDNLENSDYPDYPKYIFMSSTDFPVLLYCRLLNSQNNFIHVTLKIIHI